MLQKRWHRVSFRIKAAQLKIKHNWTYTVPSPLKGAASIKKRFFGPIHYGAFDQKLVYEHIVKIDKIHKNTPILGRFKGCSYNSRATFDYADTVVLICSKDVSGEKNESKHLIPNCFLFAPCFLYKVIHCVDCNGLRVCTPKKRQEHKQFVCSLCMDLWWTRGILYSCQDRMILLRATTHPAGRLHACLAVATNRPLRARLPLKGCEDKPVAHRVFWLSKPFKLMQ